MILRTEDSVWTDLSPEQLQKHIEHGGAYIASLIKQGKLKKANPVDRGSRLVTGSKRPCPSLVRDDGPRWMIFVSV